MEGEATNTETFEYLYASVRSWCKEEEDITPFKDYKGVDKYGETIEPTSLSAKFVDVFPEVTILLNYCV